MEFTRKIVGMNSHIIVIHANRATIASAGDDWAFSKGWEE